MVSAGSILTGHNVPKHVPEHGSGQAFVPKIGLPSGPGRRGSFSVIRPFRRRGIDHQYDAQRAADDANDTGISQKGMPSAGG